MTWTSLLLVAIVAIPLALAAFNRLRIDLAALTIAVMLGLAQFLGLGMLGPPNSPADAARAVSGFAQPVVVTLFGLFVLTRCLDDAGVTRAIARLLLRLGGASEARLVALLTTATALLSLFMNNLAAGALLLPSAMNIARRSGIAPGKLLMPVAFGSLLGGMATYFTTANIIVSNLLLTADPPQAPLGVLDFTPAGGLIALAGIVYMATAGRRLLPKREPPPEQQSSRRTGSELEDAYRLGERLWRARIGPESGISGLSLADSGIGRQLGLTVAVVTRGRQTFFAPSSTFAFQAGDTLLLIGREERVAQLQARGVRVEPGHADEHISPQGLTVVEVLLAPHSRAAGRSLRESMFRRRHGFTGVALLRQGRSYRTDVADLKLAPGDALLMIGARDRLPQLRGDADFIVLESDPSDMPVDRARAVPAIAIVGLALAASVAGLPVYLATMAGALAALLLRLVSLDDAYQSMEWRAIMLIAGMYAVSLAMVHTGLAQAAGQATMGLVAPLGPLGLAGAAFLLTAALTQVMGGQVAALVTGPIVISAAISAGASPQAIAVATAIGCSAGFLTPVAHPVNVLMMGPGNYRFGDFARVGGGLMVLTFAMLLAGMVVFWGLGRPGGY
jgi:di/tricarboxylate transporter